MRNEVFFSEQLCLHERSKERLEKVLEAMPMHIVEWEGKRKETIESIDSEVKNAEEEGRLPPIFIEGRREERGYANYNITIPDFSRCEMLFEEPSRFGTFISENGEVQILYRYRVARRNYDYMFYVGQNNGI